MSVELGLRSLWRSFVGTIGRQILSGLLQLLTIVIIARAFGPTGNGVYAVALLLPTMLASFLNVGISPAHVYYLGSRQFDTATVLGNSLLLALLLSFSGVLVGGACIWFKAEQWFPHVPRYLLWLALATFPASLLQSFIISIFQGLQKFKEFNIVLLVQSSMTLALVSLIVIYGSRELSWVIIANLTGVMISVILSLFLLAKYSRINDARINLHCMLKAFNYGYKAHLSNILAFVNYKIDIFLVNFLINPAAAGIYVVATQIGERLWLLSQAASTVLLPRLSELSHSENVRLQLTPLVARLILLLTLLASLLLAAIAYPLIKVFFGNDFLPAFIPLLILMPGIVAVSVSRVLANDLAARGRPELNMYTSAVVVVVNVAGNILLIPLYGLNGAAIATSVAYALNLFLRVAMYCHITRNTILSVIVAGRKDIRCLLGQAGR
jgi:O-antigen/teichoic acid export membrane protein